MDHAATPGPSARVVSTGNNQGDRDRNHAQELDRCSARPLPSRPTKSESPIRESCDFLVRPAWGGCLAYMGLCDGNRLDFAATAISMPSRCVQFLHTAVVFFTRRIRPFSAVPVAAKDQAASPQSGGGKKVPISRQPRRDWREIGTYFPPVDFRLTVAASPI